MRRRARLLWLGGTSGALLAALVAPWAAGAPWPAMVLGLGMGLAVGWLADRIAAREVDRAEGALADVRAEARRRAAELRAGESRLRAVLDAMVEAVFVTDATGVIVTANPALARIAGRAPEGRTPIEVIRHPALAEAVEAALRGRSQRVELDVDDRHWVAHVAPLPEGEGALAVLHDVTEMRLAERVRRDFVANASHELRTPLAAIRGYAETLRDGALADAEAARSFVERIVRHALRLQSLVDDLLALSRAESPDWAPRLEPVDVGATARTVVDELRDRAAEHGVRLSVEIEAPEGPRAQADATSLEHVLTNLVDNAIRHTRPGTHVRVRARTDAGAVLVEVADDGPGIPERHLPRIFERFYRVDPGRSRQVGGTGLGLSIVRHLVQRMGGSVSVDSQIGTGTTFTIRLRAADEGERPSA